MNCIRSNSIQYLYNNLASFEVLSTYNSHEPVGLRHHLSYSLFCDICMTDKNTQSTLFNHIHLPFLRLRKNGIGRPCLYFNVTSFAFYNTARLKRRFSLDNRDVYIVLHTRLLSIHEEILLF
jgi:hypothetical protein